MVACCAWNDVSGDPWLDPLLSELRSRAGDKPVLELGCGDGIDTAALVESGCRVIAIDNSETALTEARRRMPMAEYHCQDLRAPFPLGSGRAGVVVASLSLHYFPWQETVELVERVRHVLAPGGLFLCRLNSTNDRNHGSIGHPAIEKNYYLVAGRPKRFFSQKEVELLFASGWRVRTLVEEVIHRYAMPKVVWRVVAAATATVANGEEDARRDSVLDL
jgi:SAM-dependent methyltransferase